MTISDLFTSKVALVWLNYLIKSGVEFDQAIARTTAAFSVNDIDLVRIYFAQ
jgi:hypothetical protein